jgi:hypothetical protein
LVVVAVDQGDPVAPTIGVAMFGVVEQAGGHGGGAALQGGVEVPAGRAWPGLGGGAFGRVGR